MYAIKHWLIQEVLYEWLSDLFPIIMKDESFTDYELLLIASTVITYALVWVLYLIPVIDYLDELAVKLDDYLICRYGNSYINLRRFVPLIVYGTLHTLKYFFLKDFIHFYWYAFQLLTGLE